MTTLDERIRSNAVALDAEIAYQPNGVVSKTLIDKQAGTLTIFAFDEGQGLSEHSAPYDAFVLILDGQMDITIGGNPIVIQKGQSLIMPADVPHALQAETASKMLLMMIKQ